MRPLSVTSPTTSPTWEPVWATITFPVDWPLDRVKLENWSRGCHGEPGAARIDCPWCSPVPSRAGVGVQDMACIQSRTTHADRNKMKTSVANEPASLQTRCKVKALHSKKKSLFLRPSIPPFPLQNRGTVHVCFSHNPQVLSQLLGASQLRD